MDSHFCPGCGAPQKPVERYPWYFCSDCRDRLTDGAGRALSFGNMGLSGGLYWAYADGSRREENVTRVFCQHPAGPVMVREARFGGVVVQPQAEAPRSSGSYDWDLTGTTPYQKMRKTPGA